MLAALLATALLLDPGAPLPITFKAAPSPVAPRTTAAPVLTSVAVAVECTARRDGRVENCRVMEETHPGMGFGAAAVALMTDTRVAPGERDVQFARTIQFLP